jgi:hypothetical protein
MITDTQEFTGNPPYPISAYSVDVAVDGAEVVEQLRCQRWRGRSIDRQPPPQRAVRPNHPCPARTRYLSACRTTSPTVEGRPIAVQDYYAQRRPAGWVSRRSQAAAAASRRDRRPPERSHRVSVEGVGRVRWMSASLDTPVSSGCHRHSAAGASDDAVTLGRWGVRPAIG